ncbi:hypothetical protein BDR04DRAFT_297018 [Suillus decipiens]|nr:hypothetical protein BDR04DRAFT_297018 [Suillus decipiens]
MEFIIYFYSLPHVHQVYLLFWFSAMVFSLPSPSSSSCSWQGTRSSNIFLFRLHHELWKGAFMKLPKDVIKLCITADNHCNQRKAPQGELRNL